MSFTAAWFGGRLRELREEKGLSRKELADLAGMRSEAGIRDIEQGLSMPRWDTVAALCAALGVTCEAFQREPTEREPDKGGRPPKAPDAVEAPKPRPKRKRGKK